MVVLHKKYIVKQTLKVAKMGMAIKILSFNHKTKLKLLYFVTFIMIYITHKIIRFYLLNMNKKIVTNGIKLR
jgi:hypothetical protein